MWFSSLLPHTHILAFSSHMYWKQPGFPGTRPDMKRKELCPTHWMEMEITLLNAYCVSGLLRASSQCILLAPWEVDILSPRGNWGLERKNGLSYITL